MVRALLRAGGSMPRRLRPLVAAVVAAGFVASASTSARAQTELVAAGAASTFASTWHGDVAAGATLRAGARFARVVEVDFQGWESLATINQRLDTGLSLGVTGFLPLRAVSPFARLFAVHQHEEGLVSVAAAPVGTVFGIGSGIRHRAGGGLSLGAEVPLQPDTARPRLTFVAEATTLYFPDSTLGPSAYFGLDLGFGLDFLVR